MKNIIENFVMKMRREDIVTFTKKNNLNVSEHEIDFVYSYIKSNYQHLLSNPNSFDLTLYKNEFSNENYLFLENLINKYKKMVL